MLSKMQAAEMKASAASPVYQEDQNHQLKIPK
jgi:hypothetical protein